MPKINRKKSVSFNERLLVTDSMVSSSNLLTDLLYYDRVLIPRLQSSYKGAGLTMARDPQLEFKNELFQAGLILQPNMLIPREEIKSYDNDLAIIDKKGVSEQMNVPPSFARRRSQPRRERNQKVIDIAYLHLAKEAAIAKKYLTRMGLSATLRIKEEIKENIFETGNKSLLNVFYNQIPIIEKDDIPTKDLIDFLVDEETIRKRSDLFGWQSELENKINSGFLKVEDVPDLIMTNLESYKRHFELIKKEYKTKNIATLLNLPANIALAFTIIGIPSLASNIVEFEINKIAYKKDLLGIANKELAYIEEVKQRVKKSKVKKSKKWWNFNWKRKK